MLLSLEFPDRSMHISENEYSEMAQDLTPPSSEINPVDHHTSHVSWESETPYLPVQDALFENCECSPFYSSVVLDVVLVLW